MSLRPLVSALCVVFVAAALAPAARGQTPLGNSALIEQNFKKDLFKFKDYIQGKAPPADVGVLETAAKYYAYRFTWTSLHEAKVEPGKMDAFQLHAKDFADHIKQINFFRDRDANQPFVDKYAPILAAHFKELTNLPTVENSKSLINGLQSLPELAKLPHDSIAKYLYELVDEKSNSHDLVKLYAIRAIRELPSPSERLDAQLFDPKNGADKRSGVICPWDQGVNGPMLQDKLRLARKALDLERVDVLSKFILRPMPSKTPTSGEEEAYRYLRREAIETLGVAGYPAVSAYTLGGKAELEGAIAPVLLKVFTENLNPPSDLAGRVEAALALTNMAPMKHYDPAPAQYFIGATLVELGKEYSRDFVNIAAGAGKAGSRPLPTVFPWKITAKKFEEGLKFQAQKTADKHAVALEASGKAITDVIYAYKSLNTPVTDLNKQIDAWRPKDEFRVFKAAIKSEPLKWAPME